jgi:hypothetical protein
MQLIQLFGMSLKFMWLIRMASTYINEAFSYGAFNKKSQHEVSHS